MRFSKHLLMLLLCGCFGLNGLLGMEKESEDVAKRLEPQDDLFQAAADGKTENIKRALTNGAKVNTADANGYTALHHAAINGQDTVVRYLLRLDLNNKELDKGPETIKTKAKVNVTTKKGKTPLHLAAQYGQKVIVRILLLQAAKVDTQDKNGLTALMYAAMGECTPTIIDPKIATLEARIKEYPADDSDAAQKMSRRDKAMKAILKNELEGLEKSKKVDEDYLYVIDKLIKKGADINKKADKGILAALDETSEKDPNAGKTALMFAAANGQKLAVLRLMNDPKLKINAQDKEKLTALFSAAARGHAEIVEILLADKDKNNGSCDVGSGDGDYKIEFTKAVGPADKDLEISTGDTALSWVTHLREFEKDKSMQEKYTKIIKQLGGKVAVESET